MRDFKKRRNKGKDTLRVALGCGLLVALMFVAFSLTKAAWAMYGRFAEANQADTATHGELSNLEVQYTSVSAATDALETERGQEGALRERYGVAKPGEGTIDIVRPATTTPAQPAGSDSWWANLWHALFVW